ncbi:MAG: hypothetical protein RR945_06975 [Erysipelotrichaceae bacterium]
MKLKILGVQHYDFSDKDHNQIVGNKLHCVDERENQNGIIGIKVLTISCNEKLLNNLLGTQPTTILINKYVDVSFNQYGKVDEIQLYK